MANNLGTAWIQIKPSMSGMTSSIRSELSGVGEKEGQNVGSKFSTGFAAKIGVISAVTERVFSGAISVIRNQIDDAVYRADTLNRFPKVMEMMGYSADDASKAINKLKEGVQGIPTSLADVVSGTQRLAAITGDLGKASDWALAISDAMLVTTGDVNEASRGMEQFMQILARGKPMGQDWNTIMEVAAPVMDKLAKSLGYTSAMMDGDFYTAFQKGAISVDQVMDALVDLDKNGGQGMTALSENVRTATGGISSMMTNLNQSISNAIVDIINSIGQENIQSVITAIKNALLVLVDVIKNLMMFLKDNWNWLQYVAGATVAFFAGATVIKGILKIKNAFQSLGSTLSSIFGKGAQATLTKNAQSTFSGIGTGIKNALVSIKEILTSTVQAVMEPIKALFQGVGEAIAGFFLALADPAILLGAAVFVGVAASIAAAIFLIGTAVGAIMPVLKDLFDNIIMPIAQFIADTLLALIEATTNAVVILTNQALIPLGNFMVNSFVTILQTVAGVFKTLGDVMTNVVKVALDGVANVIRMVGDGFLKMGQAIKLALDGVQGILSQFADMIKSISAAIVAVVAMATNHSINYGNGYAHLFAQGGRVEGPGTATSDSIPAFLSDGEYVIRAATAQKIGYDNLDELNSTGHLRGGQTINFTINGYNKSPEELANIISRKIAFNTRGVIG